MTDLLGRLKALRGTVTPTDATEAERPGVDRPGRDADRGSGGSSGRDAGGPASGDLAYPAAQLDARIVRSQLGVHFVKHADLPADARHGNEPLGGGDLHELLHRQAGGVRVEGADDGTTAARPGGPVVYVDTETTGLAGGAGTFAFLIGVGRHEAQGFSVTQLFLPGPEHERSQLEALIELVAHASVVVTYNGGSFDLPLLRNRFALHDMPDPFLGTPHLDLLTVARRLWRHSLPDCSLATVEHHVLGAERDGSDVPGFEIPGIYNAFLRTRDAHDLRGVVQHNQSDIVALAALRSKVERLIQDPSEARGSESHAIARWLERLGERELALDRYKDPGAERGDAAWHASLLLKRLGRVDEAVEVWRRLGNQGRAAAWVQLAMVQEHRWRDLEGALASVEAAGHCRDARAFDLEKRRIRLLRRLGRLEP